MRKILLVILLSIPFVFSYGQDDDKEKKFGIKFTGFVKADVFYDTRQTIAARQGHFLLYPAKELLDENGDDINAKGNSTSLPSRPG